MLPAMLADSTNNHDALLALARDRSRAREIRRNVLAWLGRDGATNAALPQELVGLATDQSDNESVRQQALNTLARLPDGAGIPALTHLADDPDGGWVARASLTAIARSGDPRARDYLRGVVAKAALPDEALAVAVRGFGQQYATGADLKLIRDSWPKFTGERTQDAAISAVAEFGGSDNAAWLLDLVRGMNTTSAVRRRAIDAASRAGATSSDLAKLYDGTTDPDTKSAIISAFAQIGDRDATNKLLSIARGDPDMTARRRAVSALGRSSDPRVKDALAGIVVGGR
jgi:HEAT repeat protein